MTDANEENRVLVTCALPYANGKAHLGHLRTYIPGDMYTRSLRKLGRNVVFVCGSDMHGTPIVLNAEEEGVEPEELAMRYHRYFEETFPRINVEFDNYGHTHQESNFNRTHQIVGELEKNGYIYEDEMKVAYDPEYGRALPDRYVEGTCPYCGAEDARGDECDECGRHLEPGEIIDPVSKLSGAQAEYREQTHKFFALTEFKDYLKDFLDNLEGTPNAKNQPRQWIEDGLKDWCITRDLEWGVDYPGEDDLVLYVWVDAPIEYIASTEEWASRTNDNWRDFWQNNDSDIVHVIGGDIIQHHCVFWPALLEGSGYSKPDAVMASGLVKINDRAFSTSRGRAVWLDEDYLDRGFHPDLIRYYIVSFTGFENDLNFSWELFQERVNNELVDTLGNFIYRSLLLTWENYGEIPSGDLDEEVESQIEEAFSTYSDEIDRYNLKKATDAVMALAGYGNEYIQQNEPWSLIDEDESRAKDVLFNCACIVKAIAMLVEPLMPQKSEEIWSQLEEPEDVHELVLESDYVPETNNLGEPSHVFTQIQDSEIEEVKDSLMNRINGDEPDSEQDKYVSFDDFQSMDIRVAKIVEVEDIEDSDNLLRIEVDVGDEVRQVIAGLKGIYEPDELIGSSVVVVVNLEPTEIFGYESQGMLLAAGDQADILTTMKGSEPGTEIQ